MNIMKRSISFLLTLVMLFTMVPLNAFAAEETTEVVTEVGKVEELAETTPPEEAEILPQAEGTGEIPVTRAQWLQLLVQTFDYSIEDEIVPDNYFPDLLPEAEYYNDILIAVYYGLVDLLPNENINPDGAATREFAAYTLNACMGYLPQEESYSFSEAATATYPDDIQVAIDRGWFALENGAFNPDAPITLAEKDLMMADAESYLADMEIESGHESAYTFKEGVIEVTEEVSMNLDAQGLTITIPSLNYTLNSGDKIVVYQGGLAVPYQVVSAAVVGRGMQVRVTDLYFEDAIETMDVQMESDADPANFYAAEDAELIFIEEASGQELTQQQVVDKMASGSVGVYIPKYTRKLDLGNGVSLSIQTELKNAKVCYNADIKKTTASASVWMDTDVEMTYKLSCELTKISGDGIEIYIGGYEIPGVGGLKISVKIDVTGSVSVVKNYHMKMGVGVSFNALKWKSSVNKIYELTDRGSSINAEITAKIYLEVNFGLYGKALPIKGYLYFEGGFKATVKYTTYSEIEGVCTHFAAYLFAEYGFKVEWGFLGFEDTLDWNKEWIKEENSPVKLSFHYEDGIQIPRCTREDLHGTTTGDPSKIAESGYSTGYNSNYFGSGLSSGGSSKGYGPSNEPIIIYTYSLNDDNQATITKYSGNATTLTIPQKLDGYDVIAIGNNAFKNQTGLKTIVMQDNIVSIGESAFENCRNLRNLTLSENLTEIARYAFLNCTSLTTVEIPEGVTKIGNSMFSGCKSLQWISLPDSIVEIGNFAFENTGLTALNLPAQVQTLGGQILQGNTRVTQITIPKTVTTMYYNTSGNKGALYNSAITRIVFEEGMERIPDYAAHGVWGLTDVVIPGSVTTIARNAFDGCKNLKQIQIPDSVTAIGNYAFLNSGLTSLKLPPYLETLGGQILEGNKGVTEITVPKTVITMHYNTSGNKGAFYNSSITKMVFEEGITTIPAYAAHGTWDLTEVVLPTSVTVIGANAFDRCESLTQVQIPNGVVRIGNYAFIYSGLTSLNLPPYLEVLGAQILEGNKGVTEVTVPKTVTTMHHNTSGNKGSFYDSAVTKVIFENGITRIPAYAVHGAWDLTEVVLPASVTAIGANAFDRCESLTQVQIPDSVTEIGNYAFIYSGLTSLKLPAYLETLGAQVLVGNAGVTELTIPKTVTIMYYNTSGYKGSLYDSSVTKLIFEDGMKTIPAYAAHGAWALTEAVIPESITTISSYAFYGAAFAEFTVPNHITSIGNNVFANCTSMVTVTWPDSLTAIPNATFNGAKALETVNLPENLLSLGEDAFRNCDSLVNMDIPDRITTISGGAFSECDLLTTIELPAALQKINNNTFYNCDALTSIVIPYGVTSIGNSCFYDCDALVSVDMANSVTSMGTGVFQHCDLLKDVKLSRNLTIIPNSAFKECAELEQIVIPYFVTKIDANAFNSSPKLAKVVTHPKLTNIVSSAFSYPAVTKFYGTPDSYTQTWCTDNGYTFNENTVTAAKVTVRDSALTIPKGQTKVLDFTIDPADFGDTITFRSSNTSVVTVDETGKLTAVAPGTATIRINVGSASASCKVTVTQAVTKITLDKKTLALDVPNTYQLVATITPADASNKVLTWTSSNEAAATVDENGLITAVGNGTAVITATATDGSGISASCTVTVTDPTNIPVGGISLDKTSLSLEALETYRLTATVSPADAANKNLRWTSSNEAVATVDQNGNITAVAKGTAVITAAATDESGVTAACTVTVTNTAYVVTDAANLESPHNYPLNCTDFWLYTIPGAEKLMVTFDQRTYVEDEFDFLLVFDGEGKQVGKYSGDQLAGVTLEIPGDTVKIQLQSDDIGTDWGFKVTEVKAKKPIETIATGWSGTTQWTLTSDGVMTVYGTGNMKDYGWVGGQPWAKYAAQITAVVIEEGVTKVGSGAFKDMTALESVTLPASGLKTIGIAAFYGCIALKKITIPEGIYTIWEYTFKNCSGMESVKLPKTLIKIDQGAFEACTSLAELYLPTNVEIIGGWSFKGCTAMTRVDMQWSDVTRIRPGAFKNCTALTEIILPVNIQILGDSCFYGIGATTFTVPDTVTVIEDWCFARSALKEIIFEGNAPTIGQGAFNKITLTARYPKGNATWTAEILQNYGGTITWANS